MAGNRPTGRGSSKGSRTGREQLEKLIDEVNKRIPAYPSCDVTVSFSVEGTGARVVRTAAVATFLIVAALAVYGMITGNEGILFAVLDLAKYTLAGLLVWATGRGIQKLTQGKENDEKNKESG